MTPESQALIDLRLVQAAESLSEARLLIEKNMCRGGMDRVYFAMFYCACALLATKEFGPAEHGDVAAKFQREFVKTGLIPKEIGERLRRATQLHCDADLGAQMPPDAQRLGELLTEAEGFLTTTKLFLGKR